MNVKFSTKFVAASAAAVMALSVVDDFVLACR